ncbi:recombinase family protein [Knoellia sp. CPCC 206453]|uniref:recombinase family protein n=1 Tax=Knoellia pratensis TaxID=3404796 RepID=UPI00360B1252
MVKSSALLAVIYARTSVAQEASVSIARQVQAAEQYAAARGWQVVGTTRRSSPSSASRDATAGTVHAA